MGEYSDMKKLTYLPIIGVATGESLIFSDKILAGVGIHIMSILAIVLIIIFGNLSLKPKNILQSLTLLPLLRIVSLSIPQMYMQHMIIYGIVLIPIYLIMKYQHIIQKESGTSLSILLYRSPSFRRVYIYEPTVILTIIMIGIIGYYMGIIPSLQTIPPEIGEFASIFLVTILSISFLISDTKYWNEYVSNSINICSSPLLLAFITMVIHKVMITLQL